MSIPSAKTVLVVAAHADDESFGAGGTLLQLKEQGCKLHWLIMSKVWQPRWSKEACAKRAADIERVAQRYSFDSVEQWDFPDNRMDDHPIDDYQQKMIKVLNQHQPDTILTPGPWDWNWEHRLAFEVIESSTKPAYTSYVRQILAFEIPSSTDWAFRAYRHFVPNYYVEISSVLEQKVEACMLYSTECAEFPHPRSPEGVRHTAAMRGMECGKKAAECFFVARMIV